LRFLRPVPTESGVRPESAEALERSVGQRFVACVFEASGFPAAYQDAVQSCKVRREISFVGIPKSPPEVDILDVVFKEIQASSARVNTRRDFRAATALLARRAVDVLPLITEQLPLRDAPLGLRKMLAADTSLKILFAP
jgi:threonine dehydrogenase-like Zn-dependent dehydrogenase